MQACWQLVELFISRIVTIVPELASPQHTPVPLGHVTGESSVQDGRHYEAYNHGRGEEDIEDVVELVHIEHETNNVRQIKLQFDDLAKSKTCMTKQTKGSVRFVRKVTHPSGICVHGAMSSTHRKLCEVLTHR